jgi:hypothetical protein
MCSATMANQPVVNLFNSYDLLADPYEDDKFDCQEVIDYCEARFHVALQAMSNSTQEDQVWMSRILLRELIFLPFQFRPVDT